MPTHGQEATGMIIDCDQCQARGAGCGHCAVTTLLSAPPGGEAGGPSGEPYTDLDPATLRALNVLANAGMIPPLRYAPRLARAS
jgi:hypothetical protein